MAKPLLILLRMADSNQPHMENFRVMVLMVDDNILMYIPNIKEGDYFLPVTEEEDNENEEVSGEDDPPENILYDEYMSNTEDGIPSQDKNRL